MKPGNVYGSLHQALFEAWLQNGVCSKQNGSYYVFSQQEAKNQIKRSIGEQNYRLVKEIAEQLKSPIAPSEKNISKSLRISFLSFARLVEMALKQKVSLSTIVKTIIIDDLEKFIVNTSNRKEINSDRFNLFHKVFTTWKTEQLKDEQTSKDSYSPTIGYYPPLQRKTIETFLVKGFESIRNRCSMVPHEVLDEYLKVDWEKNIDDFSQTFADLFENIITIDQDGKLVLDISLSAFIELDMSLDEYDAFIREVSGECGFEISRSLKEALDVDEEWADDIGKVPVSFELDLLSIPLEIKGDDLIVDNMVVKNEKSDEKIRLGRTKDRDKQHLILKSRLSKALEKEDWNKVSEISDEMVQNEENFELIEYCLNIVFKLLHKKHVVSFRAPEMIVRAWEAYGQSKLEHLNLEA